jgi:hypothetical protein
MTDDDREKIEYAKKRLRRKYTGINLTSGALEAGKSYKISVLITGDDFRPAGAITNQPGEIFIANTTPPTWTNGSTLNEIKLAELHADADLTYDSATETVTLTSSSSEGGAGSGEITFEKRLLGEALEELIEELDPAWTPPPARAGGSVIQLSI